MKDYAELARLRQVTRARITQIMNLINLAPTIQEKILFMSPIVHGRDPITERQVRKLVTHSLWSAHQREYDPPRRVSCDVLNSGRD